jgi:hypothetical protein
MTIATAAFLTGTILLLAIVAALGMGLGVAALVTMAWGEAWASTAGVAAFFGMMVATLIIDDRRASY